MYVPSRTTKYTCTKCKKTRIDVKDIEEIYYQYLKSFLLTKQDLATFQVRANEAIQTKETELKSLAKERERIKKEMDKLIQLHLKDQIPTDSFKGYFDPLDAQYKQLDASATQLEGQLDFLKIQQINGDHILDNAENLYQRWPALDLSVKRQIVEELTQSIVIDSEDITIKFGYNPIILPILFVNAPNEQHNVIHALPFWNMTVTYRIPLKSIVLDETSSIGLHIKKKRLDLKLLQKDVALLVGVTEESIMHWETGRFPPQLQFYPGIIKFLGYNPFAVETETLGGKVKNYRFLKGISHKKMGKLVGVDGATISTWETGKHEPQGANLTRLNDVLSN